MIRLSIQPFSYHSDTRTFSAEASDLRIQPGRHYSAFLLVSEATSREAAFQLDRTERDPEGDIIAWHYRPIVPAVNPFGDVTVTVWND